MFDRRILQDIHDVTGRIPNQKSTSPFLTTSYLFLLFRTTALFSNLTEKGSNSHLRLLRGPLCTSTREPYKKRCIVPQASCVAASIVSFLHR